MAASYSLGFHFWQGFTDLLTSTAPGRSAGVVAGAFFILTPPAPRKLSKQASILYFFPSPVPLSWPHSSPCALDYPSCKPAGLYEPQLPKHSLLVEASIARSLSTLSPRPDIAASAQLKWLTSKTLAAPTRRTSRSERSTLKWYDAYAQILRPVENWLLTLMLSSRKPTPTTSNRGRNWCAHAKASRVVSIGTRALRPFPPCAMHTIDSCSSSPFSSDTGRNMPTSSSIFLVQSPPRWYTSEAAPASPIPSTSGQTTAPSRWRLPTSHSS